MMPYQTDTRTNDSQVSIYIASLGGHYITSLPLKPRYSLFNVP